MTKSDVYLNSNLESDFDAKIFIYKETDKRIASTFAVMDGDAVTFRIVSLRDVNIRESRAGGVECSCHDVYVCYLWCHLLQSVWMELRTLTRTSEEHAELFETKAAFCVFFCFF